MTGAVILAAGAGRRLGGVAKALLRLDDTTFLAAIAGKARAVGVEKLVVVVGTPHAHAVREEARRLAIADVVENPEPGRGMASSIELGFAAVTGCTAAYLWPVDHPFAATTTLALLADTLGAHEGARPRFAGRGGHPPLVAAALFAPLARCTRAPQGARSVLATRDVIDVPVDDAGVVHDVDTPEDLA